MGLGLWLRFCCSLGFFFLVEVWLFYRGGILVCDLVGRGFLGSIWIMEFLKGYRVFLVF